MTTLLVGAGQAAARPGDLGANARTAAQLVELAAGQQVRLLVLPEAFLVGYHPDVFAALPDERRLLGPELDPLRAAVRSTRGPLTVVVGAAVQRSAGPRLVQVVVHPDGGAEIAYEKQHLDGDERWFFETGSTPASFEIDGAHLGLSICYDGCFPEHARAAALGGASGYLVSAAWFPGGGHRRDLHYASRALENGMYVVLAGLTGECGDLDFIGGSAIYDPEGRPIARLGEEEGVAVAEIDLDLVTTTRAQHPMLVDRRDGSWAVDN